MGAGLRGRVAIVTGGGWNIGRAVALAFAGEGARVVVASRRRELLDETVRAITERGGQASAISTDVTDPGQVQAMVDFAARTYGTVDILAAFAGGGATDEAVEQMASQTWDRILRTNLTSVFYCVRAVFPIFRAVNRGVLLTCSGGGGSFAAVGPRFLPYACAKAAVCRLTDQLTAELWDTEIRVNCIDPGQVPDAERLERLEAEERQRGRPFADAEHRRRPEDVAELALWLASEASAAVRGRVVSVYDTWWRDEREVRRVEDSVTACRLRRSEPNS